MIYPDDITVEQYDKLADEEYSMFCSEAICNGSGIMRKLAYNYFSGEYEYGEEEPCLCQLNEDEHGI